MAGPVLESGVAIGRSAGKVCQICRKPIPSVAKNEALPKKWPRADFAPRNDMEIALLQYLLKKLAEHGKAAKNKKEKQKPRSATAPR